MWWPDGPGGTRRTTRRGPRRPGRVWALADGEVDAARGTRHVHPRRQHVAVRRRGACDAVLRGRHDGHTDVYRRPGEQPVPGRRAGGRSPRQLAVASARRSRVSVRRPRRWSSSARCTGMRWGRCGPRERTPSRRRCNDDRDSPGESLLLLPRVARDRQRCHRDALRSQHLRARASTGGSPTAPRARVREGSTRPRGRWRSSRPRAGRAAPRSSSRCVAAATAVGSTRINLMPVARVSASVTGSGARQRRHDRAAALLARADHDPTPPREMGIERCRAPRFRGVLGVHRHDGGGAQHGGVAHQRVHRLSAQDARDDGDRHARFAQGGHRAQVLEHRPALVQRRDRAFPLVSLAVEHADGRVALQPEHVDEVVRLLEFQRDRP